MNLSPAHIHLVLNHTPIVGVPIALFVLIWGMSKKNDAIRSLGLGLMAAMCLSVLPVYLTGEGAEDQIEDQANVSKDHLEEHEEAGAAALVIVMITGGAALGTLIFRSKGKALRLGSLFTATAAVASVGALVWTGSLGGKISHPELRIGQAAPAEAADED